MVAALLSLVAAAVALPEVALRKAESRTFSRIGFTWQLWSADVLVQNLAYDKEVFVQYYDGEELKEAKGRYVSSVSQNREVWRIEENVQLKRPATSVPNSAVDRPAIDLDFTVGYRVNGQTYWDNNNGARYQVPANAGELILDNIVVDTFRAAKRRNNIPGNFMVQALVKNLAYDKIVEVHYTVDGWRTTHKNRLQFQSSSISDGSFVRYPNQLGVEAWRFDIFDGPLGNTQISELEFAVGYYVRGQWYWDNNFGANYKISL